jgi:hypothetical protein
MSQATVTIYNAGPSAVKIAPQGGEDVKVVAAKASATKTVSDSTKPVTIEIVQDH